MTRRPRFGLRAPSLWRVAGLSGSLALAACANGMAHAPETPSESGGERDNGQLDSMQRTAVEIVRGIHSPARDRTYAKFGDDFRAFLPVAKYHALADSIDREVGALTDAIYAEESSNDASSRGILVLAKFARGARLYTIFLDGKGVLRGLLVRSLSDEDGDPGKGPADSYVALHAYGLPGLGIWSVGNGGPTKKTNNHVGNVQQWYAFDLDQVGSDGKTFSGAGKRNEDYLAFGQSVIAPYAGTIVTVVDGVPDNIPGEMNGYIAPGNYLVIDHGEREYSMICHFERGSFVVKAGSAVKSGDVLGKVGNSGHSSEPHIHWHLATSPRFEKGHGLPIRFAHLLVNGKPNDSPSPVRNDLLEALH